MKNNQPVTQQERVVADDANILSTTNTKGLISHANDEFMQISGFSEQELINKNHNVVRHPNMPSAAFANLWATIKSGKSWMGIVKNRCKNGDYYWVDAYVTPITRNGNTVEYQSVRMKPASEHVARAETLYEHLNQGTQPWWLRLPSLSLRIKLCLSTAASLATVFGTLTFLGALSSSAAAFAFAAGCALSSALIVLFTQPLKALLANARSINDNTIAQYVYTGRRDDIGAIALAIKTLESETGSVIGRIGDSASHLNEAAKTLGSAVQASTSELTTHFEETDRIATSVHQMSTSIQDVARNTQYTYDTASAATEETNIGSNIVSDALTYIEALANDMDTAAETVAKLEQRSENVNKILEVIRGIAEQTNLLALNASIEAARAGEQGRGFAVVADEIRTLASQTHASTQEIRDMIEGLQGDARHAVAAMSTSREKVSTSVERSTQAAEALAGIAERIALINSMSSDIATAVEEQSAVAEQISSSINTIRSVAETTMKSAQSTQQSSDTMAGLAKNLDTLAEQFRCKKK